MLWLAPLLLAAAQIPGAQAHSPHDIAAWVAVAPGETPAWTVTSLVRDEGWMLVRSPDRQNLETRFIAPGTEEITSATMLTESRLALGTTRMGLWLSEDVGDSYSVHPDIPSNASIAQVAPSPDILDDQQALCAGNQDETGMIWRSQDAGDTWLPVAQLDDLELADVKLSPGWSADERAFAVTRDGVVLGSDDSGESWEQRGSADEGAYQVAVGSGQRVWVAGANGLWRSDDDGVSFSLAGFEDLPVSLVLDLGDDLVLATLPDEAVWRSDDGGKSWTYQDEDLEGAASGYGNPGDNEHYFDLELAGDGSIYLAAWGGLARSTDDGLTWEHIETYLPEVIRGVAVTTDGAGVAAAVLGSNGSGVMLSALDLEKANTIGGPMPRPWTREVAASARWDKSGLVFATLSGGTARSADGGDSWGYVAEDEQGGAADIALSPDISLFPHVLGVGMVDGSGGWCFSWDTGTTWRCEPVVIEGGNSPCDAAIFSPAYVEDGMAWVGCGNLGQLLVSEDRGGSWHELGQVGLPLNEVAGAPWGELLLAGSSEGLYCAWQGEAPELCAFEGLAVWDVAISPGWEEDRTAYALVPGEGWYRSEDGAQSWQALSRPTDQLAIGLALSPAFATDQTLVVGTWAGAWQSADRGETWQQVHAVEQIDCIHPLWRYDESWEVVDEDNAVDQQYMFSATPGATAELRFRGVGLDLYLADYPPSGELEILLDGSSQGQAGPQPEGEPAWSVRQLDDSWHSLQLEAVQSPLAVDAARVWRLPWDELDWSDDIDSQPSARCGGCNAAAAGALWLPALLASMGRRRRPGRPRCQALRRSAP